MADKPHYMKSGIGKHLSIAISSSALFDLRDSDQIYREQGVKAYADYQRAHENDILMPGVAFPLVKKLLRLNTDKPVVEIILLSRNSADTGLRVFNSIAHYQLAITRAAFTSGESPYRYVKAFGAHLFLSANESDVKKALKSHCAAASLRPRQTENTNELRIRIAFDGDAVIFSDESERIFQREGLAAFAENEKQSAHIPLSDGPFKGFLQAIHHLQNAFKKDECPIQTALITARQAPAHERVIRTLRAWGIRIDESLFLGGLSKEAFLQAFDADIFFDDHTDNCHHDNPNITTAHVPDGVINES